VGHATRASSLIFFKKIGLPPLVNSSAVIKTVEMIHVMVGYGYEARDARGEYVFENQETR